MVARGPDGPVPPVTNHQTPTVVTSAMARATRIGRRGVTGILSGAPYWIVADPVMVGCTVQMNGYVPAGSGGTS
jgi:hypothetical protein